jgi:tetratricopeptide (TPR) repeat protein
MAVHKTKLSQARAMDALEQEFLVSRWQVRRIDQAANAEHVLDGIFRIPDAHQFVFFVSGLGERKENYYSLNMSRELVVENRLKLILWLTEEEAFDVSRFAPDFWAFRHRVVEFHTGRRTITTALPSGLLLWRDSHSPLEPSAVRNEIELQESIIAGLPEVAEALSLRAEAQYKLGELYWILDDLPKSRRTLDQTSDLVNGLGINLLEALIQNGLGIIAYEQGIQDDSLDHFDRAIHLHAENGIFWVNRAITLHGLNRDGLALQSMKKASNLNVESTATWIVFGHLSIAMGKYEPALAAFENILRHNSENQHALFAAATCCVRLGNKIQLEKMLQSLSAGAGDEPELEKICLKQITGDEASAVADLRSAVIAGHISAIRVQRDPLLSLIFGYETLESIQRETL